MDAISICIVLIGAIVCIAIFSRRGKDASRHDEGHVSTTSATTSAHVAVPENKQGSSKSLEEMLPREFVVFDLETTGLSPMCEEIIEIGAIKIVLETAVQSGWHTLIKPTKKIPMAATRINGITNAMVEAEGIPIDDGLRQFFDFVGDLPLVFFNAAVDIGFLKAATERCGLQFTNKYTCALKRARRAWPQLESHKLSYLSEVFELERENEHRALGDCKRAAWVFLAATTALQMKVRWSAVE